MTFPAVLLLLVLAGLAVSAISPHDYFTWFLEVAPILIGIPVLVSLRHSLGLTTLAYALLALHALILMVGGHYTYAEVPLGYWVRDALGLARNHYDRLGHFAQGFVPALVAREILLRRLPLRPGGWTLFLVTCVCLAISATYELVEWLTALLSGAAAEAFLGTQGDPWDTQWDMFLALCGALSAQVLLARVQDRQIARQGLDRPPAVVA